MHKSRCNLLSSSSQKRPGTYLWVRGSWETPPKKSDFVIQVLIFLVHLLSHTKLLTSIAYSYWATLPTQQHRFHHSSPFQPVSLAVLASCGSARVQHDAMLSNTQGRRSEVRVLRMRSSHANAFYLPFAYMVAFEVLAESLSIRGSRLLGGILIPTCTCPFLP